MSKMNKLYKKEECSHDNIFPEIHSIDWYPTKELWKKRKKEDQYFQRKDDFQVK
jgi:hypothetical protein